MLLSTTVPDLTFLLPDGTPAPLSSLLKEDRTLVVFMRHLG